MGSHSNQLLFILFDQQPRDRCIISLVYAREAWCVIAADDDLDVMESNVRALYLDTFVAQCSVVLAIGRES